MSSNLGGILTVADDFLKNDGKKFLDLMQQLAERKVKLLEDDHPSPSSHESPAFYGGSLGNSPGPKLGVPLGGMSGSFSSTNVYPEREEWETDVLGDGFSDENYDSEEEDDEEDYDEEEEYDDEEVPFFPLITSFTLNWSLSLSFVCFIGLSTIVIPY